LKDVRHYVEQKKQLILLALKSAWARTSVPGLTVHGWASQPCIRSAIGGGPFWPETFKCHSLYYVLI